MRLDDPKVPLNVNLDPKDPLELNAASPRAGTSKSAKQRVSVRVSVAKINYADVSAPVTSIQNSSFNLFVNDGFHTDTLFYDIMLRRAQSNLRCTQPCQFLEDQNLNYCFENPSITYHVIQGRKAFKVWVKFPINTSLTMLEPPGWFTPTSPKLTPHCEFFISFEVAVNGPQPIPVPMPTMATKETTPPPEPKPAAPASKAKSPTPPPKVAGEQEEISSIKIS